MELVGWQVFVEQRIVVWKQKKKRWGAEEENERYIERKREMVRVELSFELCCVGRVGERV